MKIDSSFITMTGKSSSLEVHSKEESFRFWTGNQPPGPEGSSLLSADTLELSDKGKSFLSNFSSKPCEVEESEEVLFELSDKEKQKIRLLEKILENLTGKRIRLFIPKAIKIDSQKLSPKQSEAPPSHGWGLEYDYHEYRYESQKMSFSSQGSVKTADGREISFSVDLRMSREFVSRLDLSIRAGDAKIDPLVINFDGKAPQLTDNKFSFDIDSDGRPDQISFLTQGSGFLALDLNSDGIINNGTELFGPNIGNGFLELSKYDSDGNNWIDENDPVFDKLRIWTKDADGTDRLFAIGEKGIGAIYLGNVDTAFNIKNSSNESLGEIRKTGIFLRENGTAGTINHIDFTV